MNRTRQMVSRLMMFAILTMPTISVQAIQRPVIPYVDCSELWMQQISLEQEQDVHLQAIQKLLEHGLAPDHELVLQETDLYNAVTAQLDEVRMSMRQLGC